jgi:hypothetical protein
MCNVLQSFIRKSPEMNANLWLDAGRHRVQRAIDATPSASWMLCLLVWAHLTEVSPSPFDAQARGADAPGG